MDQKHCTLESIDLSNCIILDKDFSGVEFDGADFTYTRFERVNFTGCSFENCVMENTRFTDREFLLYSL